MGQEAKQVVVACGVEQPLEKSCKVKPWQIYQMGAGGALALADSDCIQAPFLSWPEVVVFRILKN